MVGFKKRRAMWAKLDAYGEERIFEELMGGEFTVADLCNLMEMSSNMFYYWLKQSPERHRVYREMRSAMADGLVDEALVIADESTPETLGKDRERIRIRTWLAERWNRTDYGAPTAVPAAVTLNVGEMHLTALKAGPLSISDGAETSATGSETKELPAGDSVEVEGEVVD